MRAPGGGKTLFSGFSADRRLCPTTPVLHITEVLYSVGEQRPSAPVPRRPWLHVRAGQGRASAGPPWRPDLDAAATWRPQQARQTALVEDSQGLGAQGEPIDVALSRKADT